MSIIDVVDDELLKLFTVDDLWKIMKYLKDSSIDTDLNTLTTDLAKSEKTITNTYFEEILDQQTFNSADYKRLRSMFIDWYTSHRTIATTQKHASDVYQLPEEHINELFRSFGLDIALRLIPTLSKPNFFLDLVNFYKKKGTPETLLDVLDYYGYSDFGLSEYWLQKDENDNLVFRPEFVRLAASGSTIEEENDINFDSMIVADPHWFQTKDDIEALILTNKINLPSKTPYFSLNTVFSMYDLICYLSILFRVVEDQYDRNALGYTLPNDAPIRNIDEFHPILHVYVAAIYAFEKMFGDGSITTFINYGCYDGDGILYNDDVNDPQIKIVDPDSLALLVDEYKNLIKRPDDYSRDIRQENYEELLDTWSRPLTQNFLNSIHAAEPLLESLNPYLKTLIDDWFNVGDEDYIIYYLFGSIDDWIKTNISDGGPSLLLMMLGIIFKEELKAIINFFKPYRARLASMDLALAIKNPLAESIIVNDLFVVGEDLTFHDPIRPCGQDICSGDVGCQPLPITHDPIGWTYDSGEIYDIPPEHSGFQYDGDCHYDILPILQKDFTPNPSLNGVCGSICDSVEIVETIVYVPNVIPTYRSSRPYPVNMIEEVDSFGIGITDFTWYTFEQQYSYYTDWPVEAVESTGVSVVDGSLRQLTVYYTDWPIEAVDSTGVDVVDGTLVKIVVYYTNWPVEAIESSGVSVVGGTLEGLTIYYTNWSVEAIESSGVSVVGGTLVLI